VRNIELVVRIEDRLNTGDAQPASLKRTPRETEIQTRWLEDGEGTGERAPKNEEGRSAVHPGSS